ncbi:hypothetical protein D9M69_318460 [compost metagenome]
MGHTDGEHQERHQHGERIEAVAKQTQAAELPDQRGQRTAQGKQGEAHGVAVPVHRSGGQQQRQQAELQYRRSTIGDVADLLGEADYLDLELGVLELRANLLLQDPVVGHVIQVGARSIDLVEFGGDHRTALVTRNQGANEASLGRGAGNLADDLLVEALRRHRAGNQRVGAKALLGDLVDEGVGRPQRLHATARNAGQEGHRLGYVIQALEPLHAPDIPLARLDDYGQAIRPDQVITVGPKGLDVLMTDRQLLLKASVHAQLHGKPGHA